MDMYLKQKVFSWTDSFKVYDEYGNEIYDVRGEFLSLGKKLHIYDKLGNELCYIHQKVFSFLPRYFISKNGMDTAEVVKNLLF